MTESLLDEIILAADTEACAVYFDTKTEAQRKAHSSRALQWASAINGYICRGKQQYAVFDKNMGKDIEFYQQIQSQKVAFPTQFTEVSFPAARVAVLATCGFPEVKKAGILGLPAPDFAARVLIARKPTWLDKWCAYVIKEFPASHWRALYELEKSGACAVERSPGYWMSMLCGLPNTEGMYEKILADDRRLRAELWEMLADPGVMRMLAEPEQIAHEMFRKRWNSGGNIFAAKQTGTRSTTEIWRQTLVKLASDGLIDHNRLIEYSFTTLAGAAEKEAKKSIYGNVSTADFAIKLSQDLTNASIGSYVSQFTSLLGATHKDVSTYASTLLTSMPEGTLCVEEICSCISPAFLNKGKEPAEAALKLLSRLAKEDPSKRSQYGPAILSAFGHSSKDIHKKALALIESTDMLKDQELLGEFRQRLDMLAGLERTNAANLAAQYQSSEEGAGDTAGGARARAQLANAEEIYARAGALDQKWRELLLIDETIAAAKKSMRFDLPVPFDLLAFPRLDPTTIVKPISNLDDLIYMYSKTWSDQRESMDFEAVLDGVSRLCHERPADFQEKTDVLRQKAQNLTQEMLGFGWNKALAHLASSWLGVSAGSGELGQSSQSGAATTATTSAAASLGFNAVSWFGLRCLAVAERAACCQPAPLLAAPTHAGCWIDPIVLVERIVEYQKLRIEPDRVDFIQALLRLAPDNRSFALQAAASVQGETGDALRYVLGGNQKTAMKTPEYWVAALRARDPKGTNAELLKLLPNFGPDGAEPATYGLDMEPVRKFAEDRYSSISGGLPNFLPVSSSDPNFPNRQYARPQNVEQALAQRASANAYLNFPTVLLHDNSNSWVAAIGTSAWLHNRESLLALYAKRILQSIDSVGSYWHGDFELFFDPDVSMNENGRYCLCIAMSSKSNDFARLAVDALIAAVAECRIGGKCFGDAMAELLPAGVITAVRWTRGLRDLARTSPLHAHFAWQAICQLFVKAAITSTQKILFLELLVEQQVEHHFKTEDALVQALSAAKGEGKAGKLAKAILSFTGDDEGVRAAALQDLQSRIDRAERWQNWIRAGRQSALV